MALRERFRVSVYYRAHSVACTEMGDRLHVSHLRIHSGKSPTRVSMHTHIHFNLEVAMLYLGLHD